MSLLLKLLLPSSLILLLTGCASLQQELDPQVYYENTLKMEIKDSGKDLTFHGIGVLPYSLKGYEIKLSNPNRGRLDFVRFSTCHRERTYTSEGKHLTIKYKPSPIEMNGTCLLKFEAYSVKGKHGWGVLDYGTNEEELQGKLRCNGSIHKGSVLLCQSRIGLVQQISFSEDVTVSSQSPRCRVKKTGSWFRKVQFPIPRRECVYAFFSRSGRYMRLTTIGYEATLIPGK